MIVKNTTASILGIGVGKLRVLPGNNIVKDSDWDKAKKNPLIKARLESGLLVEVQQETKAKSFDEMTEKDQKAFVLDLNDLAELEKLRDFAKSSAVKSAITKQVKKIKEA